MKTCKNCDLSYDDDKMFCKKCGEPLVFINQSNQEEIRFSSTVDKTNDNIIENSKTKNENKSDFTFYKYRKYTLYLLAIILIIGGYFVTKLVFHVDILALFKKKENKVCVKCNESKLAWEWIQKAGGNGRECGNAITSDDLGNIYIVGDFQDIASVGHMNITSAGGFDIFIAKYNSSGDLKWVQRTGGISNDFGKGVAVDGNGNVYITGCIGQDSQVDYKSNTDIFITKYDSTGVTQWTQFAGGLGHDLSENIYADVQGNVFISGFYNKEATFSNQTLNASNAERTRFCAKYNFKGDLDWIKNIDLECLDFFITIDNDGNLILAYNLTRSYHLFIEKYKFSGEFLWKKEIDWESSDGWNRISGINTDQKGNIFFTGCFTGKLKFENFELLSVGKQRSINGGDENVDNIFICKFSSNGNLIWAKQKQVNNSVQTVGKSYTDAIGNTFIATTLSQTVFDEARSFESIKSLYYMYLIKFNTEGVMQWEMQADKSNGAYVYGITMDAFCNAFITGQFINNCYFGDKSISSTNRSYDVLLIKLSGIIP